MQIRCYSCHTPFSLNRDAAAAALEEITAENHNHYNAHCPRQQLLRAVPGWVPPDKREETVDAEAESEKEVEE